MTNDVVKGTVLLCFHLIASNSVFTQQEPSPLCFEYNEDGLRQKKTVNNVDTDYFYNGSVLIGMQQNTDTLLFSYDASGSVVSVNYNGDEYYYLRNAQGDVVKLIDASGAVMVEYTYNTWGKKVNVTGSLAGTLGVLNPFRYRGYVYDEETQWYYLQSRYYDPTTGRFLSADIMLSTGQGVLGHNTYAYCRNNPATKKDINGKEDEDTVDQETMVNEQTYNNTSVSQNIIVIELEPWKDELYNAIEELGMKRVRTIMAKTARSKYEEIIGEEFLLSENTIAYEIEYHIDGYLFSLGKPGYFFKRNVTTWLFSKADLNLHCKDINIDVNDIFDYPIQGGFWESRFFNYAGGLTN